jgi:hypothetical protein
MCIKRKPLDPIEPFFNCAGFGNQNQLLRNPVDRESITQQTNTPEMPAHRQMRVDMIWHCRSVGCHKNALCNLAEAQEIWICRTERRSTLIAHAQHIDGWFRRSTAILSLGSRFSSSKKRTFTRAVPDAAL